MANRTKTYIAGDWTGDKDAIDQLYKWKNSKYWSLTFTDAHDLTQSSDNSLNCSIKQSLGLRMDVSKTFVLVVGDKTKSLRAGSCMYCSDYTPWASPACKRGRSTSLKSYIEYECDKAYRDGLKIIVLYNKSYRAYSLCPDVLQNVGTHVAMKKSDGTWDYEAVKKAIMGE